jgi:hypothetical protein
MFRFLSACAALVTIVGCSTASTSNTARTGTEQLLISNAVDQAINKVDFNSFQGRTVFLNDKYLDAGGRVAADNKTADIVLEIRSGGIGTDTMETFYGIPEIAIPGMVSVPELKFATRSAQKGTAKLGFVAYDPKTSEIIGQGGVSIATSDQNNWNLLGIGPFKTGSVKEELKAVQDQDVFSPSSGLPQVVSFEASQSQSSGHIRLTSGELP